MLTSQNLLFILLILCRNCTFGKLHNVHVVYFSSAQQVYTRSVCSMFSGSKSKQRALTGGGNNNSNTAALLFAHMPDSLMELHCLLMQEMETSPLGKGSPKPLLSSLISVCYCLHLTGRENADSLHDTSYVIYLETDRCVKKRTNAI